MGRELDSEKVHYVEMEDLNFSDSELVRHVRYALISATLGDRDSYDQLNGVIHNTEFLGPDEVALLVTSLRALSGAVSYIDFVHHEALLTSIYGMSMWNYGPDVMDALVDLIISLAAASGKHLHLCLDMLVNNFLPPASFQESLKLPRGSLKKGHVLDHVNIALDKITELVPLAPMSLYPIILQKMPTVYSKEPLIAIYVENMLTLESGSIGELTGSVMLVAVVDRLVDLDVEILWEDILQDDSMRGIFEMELEDVDDILDDEEIEGDEVNGVPSSWKRVRKNLFAERIDSLLVLMFEHLKLCKSTGRLNKVFDILLKSFLTTVLNAYKSKFAQFVMFYACSLDPEGCATRFAHMLFDKFTYSDCPLTRMSALAYLASYLSRAKFLPLCFVVEMLRRLVDWCLQYCDDNHDGDINAEAHRVFYSGCQAIMYVLCFRMRSIMDTPRLKLQLLKPIEAILKHPLDPLKVCLPSIVEEFLRQAKAACLFTVSNGSFFTDQLESELSIAFGGKVERLDMFFPFDPCLLRKSDRYIRPIFIFWSMVRTTYDEDEEGRSEEDEDHIGRSIEDTNVSMVGSFEEHDLDLDEFEYSMNKMSITPKKPMIYRLGSELNGAMRMPSRIRPSTSPESL